MRRRAFTLIELICTLALLAVVALVSTRTLSTMARVWRDVPAAENATLVRDRALSAMRADVWQAPSLAAASATLTSGEVTWTFQSPGHLVRNDPAAHETTEFPVGSARWTPAPNGVLATLDGIDFFLSAERARLAHGGTR